MAKTFNLDQNYPDIMPDKHDLVGFFLVFQRILRQDHSDPDTTEAGLQNQDMWSVWESTAF